MKKWIVICLGLLLTLIVTYMFTKGKNESELEFVDNANTSSIVINREDQDLQEVDEELPAISQLIIGEDTVYQFLINNAKDAEAILTAYLFYNNYSEYDNVTNVYEDYEYLFMESFCKELKERLELTDNPGNITGDGSDVYYYYKCYSKSGYLGRIPEGYAEDLAVIAGEVYVDELFDKSKIMYNEINFVEYLSENIISVVMDSLSGYRFKIEIILDAETNRIVSIKEVKL